MNGPGFGSFSGAIKRLAPFSLRLTLDEREKLEELSTGMSMSANIMERLFDENVPVKPRGQRKPHIKDYKSFMRPSLLCQNGIHAVMRAKTVSKSMQKEMSMIGTILY